MRLKNKVTLITGGGSGIGEATVLRFSEEGAKVVINDVNVDNANSVAEKIKAKVAKYWFASPMFVRKVTLKI